MKIVSKYKDYYDAGLVYGIDEKQHFKREQTKKEVEVNFLGDIFGFKDGEYEYEIKVFPLLIGFCGDFFPAINLKIQKFFRGSNSCREETIYNYNDFLNIFINMGCSVSGKKYKHYSGAKNIENILLYKKQQLDISLESIYFYLQGISTDWSDRGEKKHYGEYMHIFSEKQVAYFIVGVFNVSSMPTKYGPRIIWHSYLITHPILKDYKFSQVKDAYAAFQEISMFLGNMNNPDDKIVQPDDKYIAFSKGFCSHSFKNRPTKSKEKPCDKKTSLE